MQQRNFVLFMIISLGILLGWTWLSQQFWPPVPPEEVEEIAWWFDKDVANEKKSEIIAGLIGTPTDATLGLGQAMRLAADLQSAERRAGFEIAKSKEIDFAALSKTKKREMRLLLSSLPSQLPLHWAQAAHIRHLFATAPKPKAEVKSLPVRSVVLGDKDYYLNVVTTTKGAGVRRVTLTDFKAADEYGLPTGKVLDLVQEDPYRPSFLMYYYPTTQATNPVPDLGEAVWDQGKLEKGEDYQQISYSTTLPEPFDHLQITKTYRLEKKTYHIGLEIKIQDTRSAAEGAKAKPFRYQLAGSHGMPVEGVWYTEVTRAAMIGWLDSEGTFTRDRQDAMVISTKLGGDPVPVSQDGADFCYAGVVTQYFASMIVPNNDQPADAKNEMLKWARPTLETEIVHGVLRVIDEKEMVVQIKDQVKHFRLLKHASANAQQRKLKPMEKVVVRYYRYQGINVATWVRRGSVPQPKMNDITVRVNSAPIKLQPGGEKVHRYMLYHGPVKLQALGQLGDKSVSPETEATYEAHHLRTLTDYGSILILSDLIIFFTGIMNWLLHMLRFVGPGLSIILLTVIVRGALFPLSKKQAMMSIKMQEIAPEMKKIQEKYKNDAKAKTEATMKLYRETGVNPLGMCLPMILQLPIFIGLYWALRESVHFRLSSFIWIRNLAAPDMLIWWGESIPLISKPDNMGGWFYLGPYFNIMPILAITMMLIHQKLFTPPPTDDQQKASQRMMRIMMMVFGLLFYKLAAGVCIYFTASSLWGFAERKLLPKKKDPGEGSNEVARTKPNAPKGGGKRKGKQRGNREPETGIKKVKNWWSELVKKASKD